MTVKLLDLANPQNHKTAEAIIRGVRDYARNFGTYGNVYWWGVGFMIFMVVFVLMALGTKIGLDFKTKLPRWGPLSFKYPHYKK